MKNLANEVKLVYVSDFKAIKDQPQVRSSSDAHRCAQYMFDKETIGYEESMYVLVLNRGNYVKCWKKLSGGALDSCLVDVRKIMALAIKSAARGIMLFHNHPSGNMRPSQADIDITKKVKNACDFHDVMLLDHLIVSPCLEAYYSFADEGLL